MQGIFNLMSTNFIIPYLNSKSTSNCYKTNFEDYIDHSYYICTAYGNKGIPIPMVEGISFVDAGVQFGTVCMMVDP